MRGYFGIGMERISKARNLGAILRTAHAFGGTFAFTVSMQHALRDINSADTSKAAAHMPLYHWADLDEMRLPLKCTLVGVELTDEAVPLPSFRHPLQAAYIFGPEKGSLSPEAQTLCDHIIKIPTRFCINVSVAAAIILYDRMISMGSFENRPVVPGGPPPVGKWVAKQSGPGLHRTGNGN